MTILRMLSLVLMNRLLLLLFLGFLSCSPPETQRPNIIWIVAEDVSPAMGCYGDSLANTPNIDWLAAHGIRYDRAYATAPICAPSRSCLISGLYATSLGTQHLRCEIPFPASLQTLPQLMAEAGYYTSNRNKTDYNFDPEGLWEHWSGSYAPWRFKKDDRPFFSFINVGPSHEGSANKKIQYEQGTEHLPQNSRVKLAGEQLPPYYPNTALSKEVWGRYYDLLHVMDQNVGKIIDSLRNDHLLEETVILFFGDHGFGMPRYKRWLYNTGLHVPLIAYIPEKFKSLFPFEKGQDTDQLVSFVDFAPSTLALAGTDIPDFMEGQPFLGSKPTKPRQSIFGARDRADDMFEMSRAIVDSQYIYIRHFMPHLPYIQSGFINSDVKDGYRALREARTAGLNNELQERIWQPKAVEELYDLKEDPYELHNLAKEDHLQSKKVAMKAQLFDWMKQHKDLGLLAESEYMIRSTDSTPYQYARNSDHYRMDEILKAADAVGTKNEQDLLPFLNHPDNAVRYWGVIGLQQLALWTTGGTKEMEAILEDPSPVVQIAAAEAILNKESSSVAVDILGKWVADERPWLALQAARSIQSVGEDARPLIPQMYAVLEKNLAPPGGKRKYKDFNFAAFTSWALEWALQELGEPITVN